MNKEDYSIKDNFRVSLLRPAIFAAVAVLHIIVIVFVAFNMNTVEMPEEPSAGVMKLVDVEEDIPPPPEKLPDTPFTNTMESIAESMIETDVVTPPIIGYVPPAAVAEREIEYLQQHLVSKVPELPDDEIIRKMIYPPIAQRSNIEGTVYLELFVDRLGLVRDVRILRETPAGRGFGEAAINAFRGIRGKPAEANGDPVAVRFRYNLNFRLN